MRRDNFLDDIDDRLMEWAFFFRDRRRLEACRSIEHRYRRVSEDFAKEGWGDMEAAPVAPAQSYRVLRAIETHEAIRTLDIKYKWSLTYAFCYPGLNRWQVLRLMKKYTKRRFTWAQYLETVDLGRMRIQAVLRNACAV